MEKIEEIIVYTIDSIKIYIEGRSMATATKNNGIYIRIDDDTKKSFSKLCEELGLSVSTAIQIIMKSSVRNKAIPVELTTINKPVALEDMSKDEFIAKIQETQEDYKNGRYMKNEDFIKYAESL